MNVMYAVIKPEYAQNARAASCSKRKGPMVRSLVVATTKITRSHASTRKKANAVSGKLLALTGENFRNCAHDLSAFKFVEL